MCLITERNFNFDVVLAIGSSCIILKTILDNIIMKTYCSISAYMTNVKILQKKIRTFLIS